MAKQFGTKPLGRALRLDMASLWALESALSALVFYAIIAVPSGGGAGWQASTLGSAQQALAFALTIGLTAAALGVYRPDTCVRARRMVASTTAAGVIAFPILLVVGRMFHINPEFLLGPDPLWPCKILVSWLACLLATRLAVSVATRHGLLQWRSSATTGATRPAASSPIRISGSAGLANLARRSAASANGWTEGGGGGGRQRQRARRIDIDALDPAWIDDARALRGSTAESIARRIGDLFIATGFLIGTAPLMALTALLIRLDSPGGVLYRQERIGLHGRPFTLLKFRSMRSDAEFGVGPSWAAKADPRITRVGSFIRRTRIDELPQILNVLRGEMSFIGPRPERPHFVAQLAEVIPHYTDRAQVKPGLTGWAQVNFPYGASVEDARVKLSYDLYYIRDRTLLLDVRILLSTIRVILFQEGAR